MSHELVSQLQRQNRLLRQSLGLGALALIGLLVVAARPIEDRARFKEIDVQRINVVDADGKPAIVIANRQRLPHLIVAGKSLQSDRGDKPGLLFYNAIGDECGGLIFDGKLDDKGKPRAGMHLSMDRFGGDQQVALGHYENDGFMETGLNVFDRGLSKDYDPLYEAYKKTPDGPEKEALLKRWKEAGGAQTSRLFVGRTRGRSSAVILADAQGRPRIMMIVTPEGQPMLNFMDDKGEVIQSLPQTPKESK
jgi:hypothetical protein